MKPSHLAALASLLLGAPVLATPVLAQGTAEQRDACMGDAWRLCKADFTGGVEAITACMKRERDKLGTACRVVMDKAERETQQAAAPKAEPAPRQAAEAAPTAPVPATPAAASPPASQQAATTPAPAPTETAPTTAQAAATPPTPAAEAPAARTAAAQAAKPPVVAKKPVVTASRKVTRTTVAAVQRTTRHAAQRVAVARPLTDDEADIREADQWMRRLGLGGLSPETVRDVRRFQAFFDVNL